MIEVSRSAKPFLLHQEYTKREIKIIVVIIYLKNQIPQNEK